MGNSALKEKAAEAEGVNPAHPAAAHVAVVDAEAGVVVPSGRKRIAVCGFASSSRPLIPVDDPSWEIWGLNQLYRHIKRADRWFDIHKNWHEETVPGTDYVGWIRDCGIPFYMADRVPELPTSVRYPIERIIARYEVDYFTSTIAFMVALAVSEIDDAVEARITAGELATKVVEVAAATSEQVHPLQGVKALYAEYEIALFGIDLVVGEEYFYQKPCAEFWLGLASSKGIMVGLPPQTALCKQQYRYGYEKEPQSPILLSELRAHSANLAKEKDQLLREIYLRDGAMQANEYWAQLMELRLRGAAVQG